jgi:hypothetical protein
MALCPSGLSRRWPCVLAIVTGFPEPPDLATLSQVPPGAYQQMERTSSRPRSPPCPMAWETPVHATCLGPRQPLPPLQPALSRVGTGSSLLLTKSPLIQSSEWLRGDNSHPQSSKAQWPCSPRTRGHQDSHTPLRQTPNSDSILYQHAKGRERAGNY